MNKPVESKYKNEMMEIEDKKTNKQKQKRFILLLLSIILLSGFISAGGIGIWYGTKDIINHNHKPHPTDPSQPELPIDLNNELADLLNKIKYGYDNGWSTPNAVDYKLIQAWLDFKNAVFNNMEQFIFNINRKDLNNVDNLKLLLFNNMKQLVISLFNTISEKYGTNELWDKVYNWFLDTFTFDIINISNFNINKQNNTIDTHIELYWRIYLVGSINGGDAMVINDNYTIKYKII